MGEGREGGTWEGEGKRGRGIQKSENRENCGQRGPLYILFYPLSITKHFKSYLEYSD